MNPFLALRDHAKEVYDTLSGNERIKERTRGLYDQVVNRGIKPSFPMLLKDPQNVTMDDLIASGFGVMPMAIKAYHGSPHLFDKFDMSKIGTGEGAQAYGHGLYMAESPDVAMSYRASTTNGFGLPNGDNVQGVANVIALKGEDFARKHYAELGDELEATIAKAKKAIDENSNLYETSLQWPDPAREAADPMGPQHFLDWDKPLSEQPESVKNALDNSDYEYGKLLGGGKIFNINSPVKAGNAYEDLTRKLKPSGTVTQVLGDGSGNSKGQYQDIVSRHLKELGIPGIRYLDQGSRGAGQGSYNYVVFDDSIPKIVKRNGKPVNTGLPTTQYSQAHETAQRNAALPIEQGGLGLPPDNTAMDRARAMGFDTEAYHGSGSNIDEFKTNNLNYNPRFVEGSYFTEVPASASDYARFATEDNNNYGANVLPVKLKLDKPLTIESMNDLKNIIETNNSDFTKDRRTRLKNAGYDSVIYKQNGIKHEIVVTDPKNIRSRFAAFDPFKRNSADILATGIMGSLLLNELKNRNAQDKPRYR